MKITVYTITDCQFSRQEKEYLKSRNLAYDEKNLETNHEFLTEMLHISDNFAGTPVTVIEKDTEVKAEKNDDKKDNKKVVLKGFTAEEFDKVLGFAKKIGEEDKTEEKKEEKPKVETKPDEKKPETEAKSAPAVVVINQPTTQAPQPPQSQQQTPSAQQQTPPQQTQVPQTPQQMANQPVVPPIQTAAESQPIMPNLTQTAPQQPAINVDPSMPAVPAPAEEAINDASLDAILKDLQEKAGAAEAASQQPGQAQATAQAQTASAPNAPAIPDFS